MSQASVKVDMDYLVTPQELAKAFWAMDSIEQAEFFEALYEESKDSYVEMQVLYMLDTLKEKPKGLRMYRTLSAYAFDFFAPIPDYIPLLDD